KCVNMRLHQHQLNAKSPAKRIGHVPEHVSSCGCSTQFQATEILYQSGSRKKREVVEAWHIQNEINNISSSTREEKPVRWLFINNIEEDENYQSMRKEGEQKVKEEKKNKQKQQIIRIICCFCFFFFSSLTFCSPFFLIL